MEPLYNDTCKDPECGTNNPKANKLCDRCTMNVIVGLSKLNEEELMDYYYSVIDIIKDMKKDDVTIDVQKETELLEEATKSLYSKLLMLEK